MAERFVLARTLTPGATAHIGARWVTVDKIVVGSVQVAVKYHGAEHHWAYYGLDGEVLIDNGGSRRSSESGIAGASNG